MTVVDRVLLSAGAHNIEACVDLAVRHGLGIEVMTFAFPDVLDGDWQGTLAGYKRLLEPVPGMISMHGPFMDMAPGSPDGRIRQVCTERYQHAIRIAQELGVEVIVFHANFIAAIQTETYRISWQQRNVDFWSRMADFAHDHNVILAVENMWEFDPDIIGDVLKKVDHPSLRACLDVGHAHLFSATPFEGWLESLRDYVVHTHMNNNDGIDDIHRAFPDGLLDYTSVLKLIRTLPHHPTITLEMDTVQDMEASLPYFQVSTAAEQWRNQIPSE
jgi:sugar phosphate isomerase/epimerase